MVVGPASGRGPLVRRYRPSGQMTPLPWAARTVDVEFREYEELRCDSDAALDRHELEGLQDRKRTRLACPTGHVPLAAGRSLRYAVVTP